MGKLEIKIHNPPEDIRGNLNWIHDIHYCGPTIISGEVKECCTSLYVFVERISRSSEYFQLTRVYNGKEIVNYEKGEENAHNKAEKIMNGLARIIKIKLIPEELRDNVEIIKY